MGKVPFSVSGGSLDPSDWQSARAQGHRMLDDILDYIEQFHTIRDVGDDLKKLIRTTYS